MTFLSFIFFYIFHLLLSSHWALLLQGSTKQNENSIQGCYLRVVNDSISNKKPTVRQSKSKLPVPESFKTRFNPYLLKKIQSMKNKGVHVFL